MANYTANLATHRILAAGAADTVQLAAQHAQVEVLNRGASDIYARADGTTPDVGADDTVIIPAGTAAKISTHGTTTQVQLISAAICAYSVTGTDS